MAKYYSVLLPISGYIALEVEAEDEAEAIKNALESKYDINDIEEWSAHEAVVEGNFFHGLKNHAEVQYIGEDDD